MLNNLTTSSNPKCNQCGADLVLKKTTTQKSEHRFASMTQNSYRCSNKSCQDEIDKKLIKRLELKQEQELARQKRLNKPIASAS